MSGCNVKLLLKYWTAKLSRVSPAFHGGVCCGFHAFIYWYLSLSLNLCLSICLCLCLYLWLNECTNIYYDKNTSVHKTYRKSKTQTTRKHMANELFLQKAQTRKRGETWCKHRKTVAPTHWHGSGCGCLNLATRNIQQNNIHTPKMSWRWTDKTLCCCLHHCLNNGPKHNWPIKFD